MQFVTSHGHLLTMVCPIQEVLWRKVMKIPTFRFHLKSFHISDTRLFLITKLTTYVSRLQQNNHRPQENKKKRKSLTYLQLQKQTYIALAYVSTHIVNFT